MKYFSTRGEEEKYTFREVILKGISSDGGLFVPEKIPPLTPEEINSLLSMNYHELVFYIFKKFEIDFADDEIKELIEKAFEKFDTPEVAPLIHLRNGLFLIELFHGPTSAFKDMALQVMPLFFEASLRKLNEERKSKNLPGVRYLILVATSGDTGTAALEGFKNREKIDITVLYPEGGVSDLQELQMITQDGKNQHVYGIKGDFDDAQNAVKYIFTDEKFIKKLDSLQIKMSSANSINWGRLLPQIVYYIYSYLTLLKKGEIRAGEEINITVPTGNFGNILAAYYAREMGIPIKKLICASNQNNILYDFITTGKYDLRSRTLVKTPSPSMDILISSNLERLLYHLTENTQKIRKWMEQIKHEGFFHVDEETQDKISSLFSAGWVNNDTTLLNIKKIYTETGYLMDPHTSVGELVAESYIGKQKDNRKMVVASTAHWAKFGVDVFKALHGYPYNVSDIPEIKGLSGVEIVRLISRETGKNIPQNINTLDRRRMIHTKIVEKNPEKIEKEILKIMG